MVYRSVLPAGLRHRDSHVVQIAGNSIVGALAHFEFIVVATYTQISGGIEIRLGGCVAVFPFIPFGLRQEFEFLIGPEIARVGKDFRTVALPDHYRTAVETPSAPDAVADYQ